MLISNRQALQDRVVELLGAAPALTALELQESLGEHARECTLQAVYQELRKLIAAGVVVKTGQHYSLRIAWLLEILAFADKAYLSHLTNATVVELLPEENDTHRWRFSSLKLLMPFLSHIGVLAMKASGESRCYEYLPHVWYHLLQGPEERQFLSATELSRVKYYLAVGHATYLDRQYVKQFRALLADYCLGEAALGARYRNSQIAIIGPYVMKVRFNRRLRQSIDTLFESVKGAADASPALISNLVEQRAQVSLELSHSAKKAELLRNKIQKYFQT